MLFQCRIISTVTHITNTTKSLKTSVSSNSSCRFGLFVYITFTTVQWFCCRNKNPEFSAIQLHQPQKWQISNRKCVLEQLGFLKKIKNDLENISGQQDVVKRWIDQFLFLTIFLTIIGNREKYSQPQTPNPKNTI